MTTLNFTREDLWNCVSSEPCCGGCYFAEQQLDHIERQQHELEEEAAQQLLPDLAANAPV